MTKAKRPSQPPTRKVHFYAVRTNPGWIPARWAVQAQTSTREEAAAIAVELNRRALNQQKGK